MKAQVRFYLKNVLQGRYVLELTIHEVGHSLKYPDGVKYGLICKDMRTGSYVLMDNHHPKGPHIHINNEEYGYHFSDDDTLIEDFKKLVFKELGVKL